MSEVQVVEDHEVLVPLDRLKAEKLDGRIRRLAKQAGDQLLTVGRLLDEARAGRAHEALGFPSWTAYVADALGGTLQLSGEARQAMVQMMAGEGMSVRAISAATGVSKSTVDRDLSQVSHDGTADIESAPESTVPQRDSSQSPPEKVSVGLDGKTRRKPRPKRPAAKPEPAKSERKVQIPTAYREKVKELKPVVAELQKLTTDPRWSKAAQRFTPDDRVVLDTHITALQDFRTSMGDLESTTISTPEEKTA